jgi:cell division protein FtsI (penicillin-binding protein 3)
MRRLRVLKLLLALGFVIVAFRLVQIQVLEAPRYQEIARRQHEARVVLPAARGALADREGTMLVSNMVAVSFAADPKLVDGAAPRIAERFSRVFGKTPRWYLSRLREKERRFVWLERRVSPDIAPRLRAAELPGVIELSEPKRLYHYDRVAGQLIGFTDVDNRGLDGLELALDDYLRGMDGSMVLRRDGLGRTRPSPEAPRVEPINGKNVFLTIDIETQSVAEEELRKGLERTKAQSGLVIMLDPATGEVLAMANAPSVSPGTPSGSGTDRLRNRVITDMFEPGSVFKLVTACSAIESRVASPGDRFSAENGRYRIRYAGGKIREIRDTKPHSVLTFRQAVELSSNIVMAKVADRIGSERLFVAARNFGFGTRTGIELPGEAPGELKKPTHWSGATLHSMAYGYEVAATPLQIAAAYAAVANGGVLMKPFLIRRIVDDQGRVIAETHPQAVRRVVSQQTAGLVTEFLTGTVERGTGKEARIDWLSIAGKTGTSRKFSDGRYVTGSYTASFAGFFPADQPRVVCLVMLDNPSAGGYTGGEASAPIFRGIAEKVAGRYGDFTAVLSPSDRGPRRAARAPRTGTKERTIVQPREVVTVAATGGNTGPIRIPDLRGLSLRRALATLRLHGLDATVAGSGLVVAQNPGAGRRAPRGTRVSLRCELRDFSDVGW